MADRVGQQLGNYRLVRLLGSGGFADVYQGEHVYLNRAVAVKVLHVHLVQQEFPGFLQEAQTIARLTHPHIIPVLDFGIDGTPFLVMEYLPLGSLRERHRPGTPISLSVIISYVQQIAGALQYAHDAKVIHRDVKPANVLLRTNEQLVLSDFGIATVAHRTTSLQTLMVSGSPAYMAPEQIAGKPRPASDQYALGMMVYEWLCGKPAFQGEPFAVMYQQTSQPVPPLREHVPTVPPRVEHVVLKALAKDPQQRFASVQEFTKALEQACQSPLLFSTSTPSSHSSPPSDSTPLPSQSSLAERPTAPLSQSPLPPGSATPPSTSQPLKRAISRRAVLLGLVGLVVAGCLAWLLTGGVAGLFPGMANTGNVSITGSITSVDTTNNTVTLNAGGQTVTVKGLTAQQVAALQPQVGKVYTISVTQNSDGTYTITTGTEPINDEATPGVAQGIQTQTPQANNTQTATVNEPGSIQFKGRVQQVSNNSIVVSMPSGQNLTMSIVSGITDLTAFNNALPALGQLVWVKAVSNTNDGSFTATKLSTADPTDSDLNVVQYQGVTTSAVGSDNVIHFKIGNQSFSFTIGANADLHAFNNNAQSIGSNQSVTVRVIFQGNNGTVQMVSN
jgi:hypothetical protein